MTSNSLSPRAFHGRLATAATLATTLLTAGGCTDQHDTETLRFAHGASDVEVVFHGEVADDEIFGPRHSLLDRVRPRDEKGRPRGRAVNARPGWLHFEYRIDGRRREVLIAKQPLLNQVSWDDVARAGAALAERSAIDVAGALLPQDARLKDARGYEYRVRLPSCGRSTLSDLSEWNLLIGAVHRGDPDFTGSRYGWVRKPYDDDDLKVGYHGSLNWCQELWQDQDRVARGYFFVSRLHAAAADLRTDRLHWRPVLEREPPTPEPSAVHRFDIAGATVQWAPSGRVSYVGAVENASLFGRAESIAGRVSVEGGRFVGNGQPEWLRFIVDGRVLLIAAHPVKYSVSWDAIAQAGAALGDGSNVRIGWRTYRQDAQVTGADGTRYRVRLLQCGRSTMDLSSEWNQLIGGVHRGDGDFGALPRGPYAWLDPPMNDGDLHIGMSDGSATWCQERIEVDGKLHGVNRGYLTVSRFHATETDYTGTGFGWRPVLESIP